MKGSARWGRVLAIALLVMLYPTLTVAFHGRPSSLQLAGTLLILAAMASIYCWFWLWGLGLANWRVVTAIVVSLAILALLVNVVSGVWTINGFLLPLVIAGYAYRPRIAVAAILALTVGSIAVSVPPATAVLNVSAGDMVALVIITAVQLLLVGFGAAGFAWTVRTIAELRAAREQLAMLAVEQERSRIARDVHDLMGHSLSVITLKGELAGQLIRSAPDQAQSEVRDIVRVARNALREVREAVSGYRQPTLATELEGARAALTAAGMECTIEQSAGALTRETETVLAWTVREGATNVLRHSKAKRCSIRMSRDDDNVHLDVVDDGAGTASPQAGNGLRGLGERVTEQGGRLEAGPLPNQGFRLRVTLPIGGTQAPTRSNPVVRFDAETDLPDE